MNITVRLETEKDYRLVEEVTRSAFGYQERIERGQIGCPDEHCEELAYRKYECENLFLTGDETFDGIACKLYATARAYDELTKRFYPEYEGRSEVLFDIWRCYHENRYLS